MRIERLKTALSEDWTHQDEETWDTVINNLGTAVREKGDLIIIPTETVYGLGANAFDKNAVLRIYKAKGRPLNDPVICHVAGFEEAKKLFNCDKVELEIIERLADAFWPGPLSIVGRASSLVDPIITAHTGFVAVRCPKNKVAIDLIKASGVPIAAPSANKFGHISPSCPSHVIKNFGADINSDNEQKILYLLDGGSCSIGIESTVCKIERKSDDDIEIEILRRGNIPKDQIQKIVDDTQIPNKENNGTWKHNISVKVSSCINYTTIHRETPINQSSPGMLLTHYSPSVPTFLISIPSNCQSVPQQFELLAPDLQRTPLHINIRNCIIIDAFNNLIQFQTIVNGYFSLTKCSKVDERSPDFMQLHVFNVLHQAEDLALQTRSDRILIADFESEAVKLGESGLAVYDRLYRSASGRRIVSIVG